LRFPPTPQALWDFVWAVYLAEPPGGGVELELVNGSTDKHVHVGLFSALEARKSGIIVRAD